MTGLDDGDLHVSLGISLLELRARGRRPTARGAERGLPLPQRLDAREERAEAAEGAFCRELVSRGVESSRTSCNVSQAIRRQPGQTNQPLGRRQP